MITLKKNIIALCGSTKLISTNIDLLNSISILTKDQFNIHIYPSLTLLPHFNPDIDNEIQVPNTVKDFRVAFKNADGIIISTPEYAMGVPGTLKNALDWTVSSMEFSNKPVALFTASTSGYKAHDSLLNTLQVIEANIMNTHLVISFAKTKIKNTTIVDDKTKAEVIAILSNFQQKLL
jgi:chromate reductase, NAD(P)H dehydrogenase (quinone)